MDQDHYVPEVHKSTGGRRLFRVDFYTHGTNERKHWLLIVDEVTDYAHSIVLKQKRDQ